MAGYSGSELFHPTNDRIVGGGAGEQKIDKENKNETRRSIKMTRC